MAQDVNPEVCLNLPWFKVSSGNPCAGDINDAPLNWWFTDAPLVMGCWFIKEEKLRVRIYDREGTCSTGNHQKLYSQSQKGAC